eukprot:TRINITY_DN13758_c0_g1_i2.p1 TRINITY_DN13758_c0_g1~~TRINITY_DN13758_c0_g1_i2.p1  ORF type:complete len:373 (-),score=127.51 TRINITY_DN13758_c0_g1_i2:284-1402(-)
MIRRPPKSTLSSSSAASDVYKRQAMAEAEKPASPVAENTQELETAIRRCLQAEAVAEELSAQMKHNMDREGAFMQVVDELKAAVVLKEAQLQMVLQEQERDANERARVMESVQLLERQLNQMKAQGLQNAKQVPGAEDEHTGVLKQQNTSLRAQVVAETEARQRTEQGRDEAQRAQQHAQRELHKLREEMREERARFMMLMKQAETMLGEASTQAAGSAHNSPEPPHPAVDTPRGFELRKELELYHNSSRATPVVPPQQTPNLGSRSSSGRRHSSHSLPFSISMSSHGQSISPSRESVNSETSAMYEQARRNLNDLRSTSDKYGEMPVPGPMGLMRPEEGSMHSIDHVLCSLQGDMQRQEDSMRRLRCSLKM